MKKLNARTLTTILSIVLALAKALSNVLSGINDLDAENESSNDDYNE